MKAPTTATQVLDLGYMRRADLIREASSHCFLEDLTAEEVQAMTRTQIMDHVREAVLLASVTHDRQETGTPFDADVYFGFKPDPNAPAPTPKRRRRTAAERLEAAANKVDAAATATQRRRRARS